MFYFTVHEPEGRILVLFNSARTIRVRTMFYFNQGLGPGVISQCTNIRVGLRCYFIVHKHEGRDHVLFYSARTGRQGACVISQCTNRRVGVRFYFHGARTGGQWVRKERTMYHVPRDMHLMNFFPRELNFTFKMPF